MFMPTTHTGTHSVLAMSIMLVMAMLLLALPVFGQQKDVTRFDAFAGYTFLNSPQISLPENGLHTQIGVRVRRWVSLGFDYSISKGTLKLTPDLLVPSLQQQLGGQLAQLAAAGLIPPGYKLMVPADSTTQTFAGGPQFAYRHFSKITFFIRPSAGIIHEVATPRPGDAITTMVVRQLAPTGKKTDRALFYGFGGGVDINFSPNFGLRMQADLVRDHLFNDLLANSRGTVRVSIGPCFNFGKNIAK
jgi:hypothetical protein